jgi:steroid 5-alpha reductase family enzyme
MHDVLVRLLLVNALILFVYMSICYYIARVRRRLDTVDIAWGLGFIVIACSAFVYRPSGRNLLILAIVSIWGLRLASHIYMRSKKRDEDRRYKELTTRWKGNIWLRAYYSIYLVQGLLILIIGIPIMVAIQQQLPGLAWLSIMGTVIWIVGFIIESTADAQLANYLKLDNRPKVLQTGLWSYSRHPNYFGELLQWWGVACIALQVSYGWIGLVGPLTLSILIIFVSGIPPIERHRSKDQEYRIYQKQTSVLIPWMRRNINE